MGSLSGQDIFDNFNAKARGTASLSDAQQTALKMAGSYDDHAVNGQRIIDALRDGWTGAASEAATQGLVPLAEAAFGTASALNTAQDLVYRQLGSFHLAKNTVRPMPPEPTFTNVIESAALGESPVSVYQQTQQYSATAQNNVDAYQTYVDASRYNADNLSKLSTSLPTSVPDISVAPPTPAGSSNPGPGAPPMPGGSTAPRAASGLKTSAAPGAAAPAAGPGDGGAVAGGSGAGGSSGGGSNGTGGGSTPPAAATSPSGAGSGGTASVSSAPIAAGTGVPGAGSAAAGANAGSGSGGYGGGTGVPGGGWSGAPEEGNEGQGAGSGAGSGASGGAGSGVGSGAARAGGAARTGEVRERGDVRGEAEPEAGGGGEREPAAGPLGAGRGAPRDGDAEHRRKVPYEEDLFTVTEKVAPAVIGEWAGRETDEHHEP